MNLRSMALAALSGILLAVTFPTVNLAFLAWIALVPLFIALKEKTTAQGFWLGEITGIFFFGGTIYWVTNSVHFYGGIPLLPASFITFSLCAALALYVALFGAVMAYLREKKPAMLFFVSAPAVWTTFELARAHTFFNGFPWSLLGYSQFHILPIVQIADITSVYGVSFLIVMVNAVVVDFLRDKKQYAGLIAAAVIIAIVLGYGFMRLNTADSGNGITISVIQGNIEQDKKWDRSYQMEVIGIYKGLTKEALTQRPDLVIWPETATPFYFNGIGENDSVMTKDLIDFVKQNRVPLLTGSPTYEVKPSRQIIGRNSAFLLSSQGNVEAVYHKMHLVPFGEYVPLKSILFFVGKMVQAIGDFQAGTDYTVMTVPYGEPGQRKEAKLCTVICYEIIFPELVRKFVNDGAQIVTTVTNDAWFGKTGAPYQHFSMAVFRAIENRVPVARAANTGISGFIDSRGRILQTSGIFTEAYLTHRLTPGTERTFYTQYGDLFAYACVLACLALLASTWKRASK